jgi:hypothetical protein
MNANKNKSKTLSLGLCIWLGLSVAALNAAENHGQVTFAGVPVPGAKVTATKGDQKLTAVTDMNGVYSFPDLADGTWTIQVEMLGFTTAKNDVEASASPMWELKMLPLAEMSAQIQAPAIRTEVRTPTPAAAAAPKAAAPKPDPAKPATTQAAAPAAAAAAPADPGPTEELSQRAADGLLINGSTNNGASSPFALNPAFGNNRRGGRSLYNGNIGMTVDNSALDARQFSITGQDTPKPSTSKLIGLVNFGGPIKIPKLLPRNGPNFTVNYQWTRSANGSTQPYLVPTMVQRQGDLSSIPVQITDPSGAPFVGNQIPLSQISKQATALLGYYPLPNFFGSSRYNYQTPLVSNTHSDAVQTRLNKGLGRKNQLSGLFAMQSTRGDNPNVFGFLDTSRSLGFNSNFTWRRTYTPRFYGNFSYTFSRQSSTQNPFFANLANVSALAGIAGNNQDPVNWGPPSLNFSTGFAGLNDGLFSISHNQTGTASYSSTWNHRQHNFTFGADYQNQQFNNVGQQNPRGNFTFNGATTGSDFASFLLGIPDQSSIAFGNADKYLRAHGSDAFIDDDWKIRPSLTLHVGARWQYSSPITEKYGRLVNLDVAPGFASVAPVVATNAVGPLTGLAYPNSLVHPDKHALMPKVSLAWRPISGSSLLIRTGYDINYDTSVYNAIARQMWQQSPLSTSLRVANSALDPLTLANGFVGSPNITSDTFAIDPNFRLGYVQNWNFIVQRDLPFSLQLVATYNGTKGTRAMQEFLPNTYPVGGVNPCPTCPSGFTYLTSNGNSTREAGVLQLRRRMRSGFTATLTYTYAHAIDDAALGGSVGGALIAQDWLNLSGERGNSSFDQRHLLSVQLQYTTGLGIGGGTLLTGWRGAAFKEWTVATNVNAGTGLPLSPVYSATTAGSGVNQNLRPDFTGLSVNSAPAGLFLNPAAYTAPAPGTWGNAGRDSITGPSQFSMNMTMLRTFRMTDRMSLDVQATASNLLNHVTYPSWNTTLGSLQFGLPTTANAMRSMSTNVRLRF